MSWANYPVSHNSGIMQGLETNKLQMASTKHVQSKTTCLFTVQKEQSTEVRIRIMQNNLDTWKADRNGNFNLSHHRMVGLI